MSCENGEVEIYEQYDKRSTTTFSPNTLENC